MTSLISKNHSSPHRNCFKSMVEVSFPGLAVPVKKMELQFVRKALASDGVCLDLWFSRNKCLMPSVKVNNLHKLNILLHIFKSSKLTYIDIILGVFFFCTYIFFSKI